MCTLQPEQTVECAGIDVIFEFCNGNHALRQTVIVGEVRISRGQGYCEYTVVHNPPKRTVMVVFDVGDIVVRHTCCLIQCIEDSSVLV